MWNTIWRKLGFSLRVKCKSSLLIKLGLGRRGTDCSFKASNAYQHLLAPSAFHKLLLHFMPPLVLSHLSSQTYCKLLLIMSLFTTVLSCHLLFFPSIFVSFPYCSEIAITICTTYILSLWWNRLKWRTQEIYDQLLPSLTQSFQTTRFVLI